jgi:sulfur carrier protein
VVQIQVNGETQEVPDEFTVAELLVQLGLQPKYLAVERNLILIPREEHASCTLQEGDRLEIVTLVGGG